MRRLFQKSSSGRKDRATRNGGTAKADPPEFDGDVGVGDHSSSTPNKSSCFLVNNHNGDDLDDEVEVNADDSGNDTVDCSRSSLIPHSVAAATPNNVHNSRGAAVDAPEQRGTSSSAIRSSVDSATSHNSSNNNGNVGSSIAGMERAPPSSSSHGSLSSQQERNRHRAGRAEDSYLLPLQLQSTYIEDEDHDTLLSVGVHGPVSDDAPLQIHESQQTPQPQQQRLPDLSNLWQKKQSTDGYSSGSSRGGGGVIRYPQLNEYMVRVPPTEAILTKVVPYQTFNDNHNHNNARKKQEPSGIAETTPAGTTGPSTTAGRITGSRGSSTSTSMVPPIHRLNVQASMEQNGIAPQSEKSRTPPPATTTKPGAVGMTVHAAFGADAKTGKGTGAAAATTTNGGLPVAKPGAVAVSGSSDLPLRVKTTEEITRKTVSPRDPSVAESSLSSIRPASSLSNHAVARRILTNQSSSGAGSSLGLTSNNSSSEDKQPSLDSSDSAWGKKLPSTIKLAPNDDNNNTAGGPVDPSKSQPWPPQQQSAAAEARNKPAAALVTPRPLLPMSRLKGSLPARSSLLDDDDDDDEINKDGGVQSTAAAVAAANSIMGFAVAAAAPQPIVHGGELMNPLQQQQQAPPIWGRKSRKATLEEDAVDSRELAFASGGSLTTTGEWSKRSDPTTNNKSELNSIEENRGQTASIDAAAAARGNYLPPAGNVDTVDSRREQELLETAILESKKQMELQTDENLHFVRLMDDDIEDAKENARSVRSMIASERVDVGFLQTVLELCRADQERVARGIEDAMNHQHEEEADLEVLIDLNINLLDAIEMGERVAITGEQKPASVKKKVTSINLDVEDLVEKKDIFSLICMLRVQQSEKRLDAAYALMSFARAAENDGDDTSINLRDEIRSSGGLYSLLTLFRTPGTPYELKVVTALAVAYVLPSFVEASTHLPPPLGLKIVECLRFLTTAETVSHNGEKIEVNEMFRACHVALSEFWVSLLEPVLKAKSTETIESEPLKRKVSQGRQRIRGGEQRLESIVLDELLETSVSLIILVAKKEPTSSTNKSEVDKSFKWGITLIEQVCALDSARPIAVREGILQLLVSWILSKDVEKIQLAVSALRYVTSIDDKYMAGWIHSEMVNKGAVKCLADLTQDLSVTRDVRLHIAQILSSLCAASHTRAAIVEANCINFLVGILYEHNDPSSEEIALFAGRAILQLAAGAVTRASVFTDDFEVQNYSPTSKQDSLVG